MVHRILRRDKRRQANYANRKSVDVDLIVGDLVYYKNNQRQSKLQAKWKPLFINIEQPSPVTFEIKNQLDGKVTKTHKLLRLARIDKWDIPSDDGRALRKATYVIPQDSESDSANDDSDNDMNNESNSFKPNSGAKSDVESVSSDKDLLRVNKSVGEELFPESDDEEDNIPLAQLSRKYKKRDNSFSEDGIPLFELILETNLTLFYYWTYYFLYLCYY